MTQADWVKEETKKPSEDGSLAEVHAVQTDYTSFYLPGNGHGLRLLMTNGTSRVMEVEDIKKIITLAQQRTEKKWSNKIKKIVKDNTVRGYASSQGMAIDLIELVDLLK